jgi:large subunit ribosomal protein L32
MQLPSPGQLDKGRSGPYDNLTLLSACPTIASFTSEGTCKGKRVMAVPKRRTSHARQGKRRSHLHIKPLQIQYCPHCNEPVLPHRICPNCGFYQGREAVAPEEEK